MNTEMNIAAEPTPNPNSLKFSWGEKLVDNGPFDFSNLESAADSPFAQALFRQQGVVGVFIGSDFVTVTKHPGVAWELLQVMVTGAIEAHISSGQPLVNNDAQPAAATGDLEEVEARIKKVLDEQIRPAVAMDGGDIQYVGFNAGVVLLQMKGACHGCPSSSLTLKLGIEKRLKEAVPEVLEVTALA
ncbi:MAG: Fe-S cluster biogenesis protein NfuA [Planctomycetota bacterium]|jgi:Fe-S cluster biogenesis protein NfuA